VCVILGDVVQVRADTGSPVLQDPSVAASPIEKKIAFLQAKNLTQEEVNAALARASTEGAPVQAYTQQAASSSVTQPPPYYGQYPSQYPSYAWQPPPQPVPRRDWRDWFIMATVVSGVSYGLYTLGQVKDLELCSCTPYS
jgi:peroxin-14